MYLCGILFKAACILLIEWFGLVYSLACMSYRQPPDHFLSERRKDWLAVLNSPQFSDWCAVPFSVRAALCPVMQKMHEQSNYTLYQYSLEHNRISKKLSIVCANQESGSADDHS